MSLFAFFFLPHNRFVRNGFGNLAGLGTVIASLSVQDDFFFTHKIVRFMRLEVLITLSQMYQEEVFARERLSIHEFGTITDPVTTKRIIEADVRSKHG
jgi:hypothetical protein